MPRNDDETMNREQKSLKGGHIFRSMTWFLKGVDVIKFLYTPSQRQKVGFPGRWRAAGDLINESALKQNIQVLLDSRRIRRKKDRLQKHEDFIQNPTTFINISQNRYSKINMVTCFIYLFMVIFTLKLWRSKTGMEARCSCLPPGGWLQGSEYFRMPDSNKCTEAPPIWTGSVCVLPAQTAIIAADKIASSVNNAS